MEAQLEKKADIESFDSSSEKREGLSQYLDINYLTGENAKFAITAGGLISLEYKDKKYDRVSLHRSFPFSLIDEYISVRDEKGNEIGIIKALANFSEKTIELLKEELAWVYYCPEIIKIISIKEEFGYSYWKVETNKGEKEFTIREISQNLIPITETRILINDITGNRYEIADFTKLDSASLKLISSLV